MCLWFNAGPVVMVFALVGATGNAPAAPATPPEATRTLGPGAPAMAQNRYLIGLQLYRDGKYAEAAREFEVALQVFPDSATLTYNLARSEERAGRGREALTGYKRYLVLARKAKDRAEVEAVIAVLERRLAAEPTRLVVRSQPERAQVFLDGSPEAWGVTPMQGEVAPGPHALRLEKTGFLANRQSVDAPAGRETAIVVTLMAARVEPDVGPAPAPSDSPMRPVLGWSGVALGAVGVGLGAYFGVGATDARSQADTLRGEPDRHDELEQSYDQDMLGMGVAGGLGLALLATGIYFLVTDAGTP